MLFSEYCKLRCRTGGISMKEVKLLGIDKKKGWMKRFKDLEIDGAMLHRLTSVVVSNRRAPQAAKTKLMEVQKHYVVDDIQMLYLMRSEVGNLKIGISKDPISRARDITNASGLVVECIAYWKLDKALLVENGSELFWMAKSRVISVDEVNSKILCMHGTTCINVE